MNRQRLVTFSLASCALLGAAFTGCSSPNTGSPPAGKAGPLAAAIVAPRPLSAARTPLPGSMHPYAKPERDIGRMPASYPLQSLSLLFQRTPAQEKQLARDMVAIQDPTSPSYHRWLSAKDFGTRYGAAPADIERARAWLVSQGFTVGDVSPSANRIAFRGTVGAVEHAFQTEMHRYQVRGQGHYAPSRPPSVPATLGSLVAGVHGTNDFKPPPHAPVGGKVPEASFQGAYALGPADWATIYDVNPLYSNSITGTGQSIAIVGESYYYPADIVAFRTTFGLDVTNVPIDVLVPNTGSSAVLDDGDLQESELDMEWSGGIAKDAQVYFVYTGDSEEGFGFLDALLYAVEQRTAPVVSVSYGLCEVGLSPSDAIFYGQTGDVAAMEGMTVLVSSGDAGPAACDADGMAGTYGEWVAFPASISTVTAVGGTQFAFAGEDSTYWSGQSAALQYIPEQGWNQTFVLHADGLGASGGGYSVVFKRPYWQAGALPSSAFRGVPDISFSASSYTVPYIIEVTPGMGLPPALTAIGGTSASSPSFAGVVALLNQSINAPTPGLGTLGPVMYALSASTPPTTSIASGSNGATLPQGTIDVGPTTGFASSGTVYVTSSSGVEAVTYTGVTDTSFTGCSGGVGALVTGNAVVARAFHDVTAGDNIIPCTPGSPDCPASNEYGYSCTAGYDLVTGLGSLDVANFVNAWTALAPTNTTLVATPSGTTEGSPLTLAATVGSNATAKTMTGTVTFYFDTFTAGGQPDIAYFLGSTAVTATVGSGGVQGGTATLMTAAPVGLTGAAKIVAFYGGDDNYLASYSQAASTTATTTLAVTPPSATIRPNQRTMFSTTGGVPPVTWHLLSDGTCNDYGQECSQFLPQGATSTEFQAGYGNDGTVTLAAVDSDYAEVRVTITVSGAAVDGGLLIPPEAGVDGGRKDASNDAEVPPEQDANLPPFDAGFDSGSVAMDAGNHHADANVPDDAGSPAEDASAKTDASASSSSSGGCNVAAAPSNKIPDLGLLLLVVPMAIRRRRSVVRSSRD